MYCMLNGCIACDYGLKSGVSASKHEFYRSDTDELRLSEALFA